MDPLASSWKMQKLSRRIILSASLVKGDVVVVKEKILEDKNPIKLKEEATPKPVNPFSKELGTGEMTQESKLLSVSQFEDTVSSGAGDKMNMDEGLIQYVAVGIGKDGKKAVPVASDSVADFVKGVSFDHDSTNDANDENEESDQEFYMQAVLVEGTERKESEIFICGLDKGAVEDDLVKVFKAFGDIQSVRIVKHPTTNKSNGFAFIGFSSSDHARL